MAAGYTGIMPPLMVNEASGLRTGQLPDKRGHVLDVTLDNYYLIPTAEVPVTNIYRDVILTNPIFRSRLTAQDALVPPGSGLLRQGCARIQPAAPVR